MIAFGGKRIDAVKNGGKTNERLPFCKPNERNSLHFIIFVQYYRISVLSLKKANQTIPKHVSTCGHPHDAIPGTWKP
jgi:hypothetical protein